MLVIFNITWPIFTLFSISSYCLYSCATAQVFSNRKKTASSEKRMMWIVHQNMISCLPFLLNPIAFAFLFHPDFSDCLNQPKPSYIVPILNTSSWKKYMNQNTKTANVCRYWGSKCTRILRGRWRGILLSYLKDPTQLLGTEHCLLRSLGSIEFELPFPFVAGRQVPPHSEAGHSGRSLHSHSQQAKYNPLGTGAARPRACRGDCALACAHSGRQRKAMIFKPWEKSSLISQPALPERGLD